ncbi:MAG TPA: hypothetical protein VE779_05140, partial [Candidatus Angelobacter sp.]|nr:hypothetical protein [Candidatus Angelobacter sp.]
MNQDQKAPEPETESKKDKQEKSPLTRREILTGLAATAAVATSTLAGCSKEPEKAATAAVASQPAPVSDMTGPCVAKNPYGGGPGAGISLPPYFRPTASLKNNNVYYP